MFRRSDHYGDYLNSFDLLKLIALFTMLIDHLGYYLMPGIGWPRAIGRMAFPIFLFLVGFSGRWKSKYDIFIWALILTLCAGCTHHAIFPLDILVSIVMVRWAMSSLCDRGKLTPVYLGAIFISCIIWYPLFYWFDYSTIGLLFAMSGYLQKHMPRSRIATIFLVLTIVLYMLLESYVFYAFTPLQRVCMIAVLSLAMGMMYSFNLQPVDAHFLPPYMRRPLQWMARNTLPIYGLHVMLLMIIERLYFPQWLRHFQWIAF